MTDRVSRTQGSHTWFTAQHERKLRRRPSASRIGISDDYLALNYVTETFPLTGGGAGGSPTVCQPSWDTTPISTAPWVQSVTATDITLDSGYYSLSWQVAMLQASIDVLGSFRMWGGSLGTSIHDDFHGKQSGDTFWMWQRCYLTFVHVSQPLGPISYEAQSRYNGDAFGAGDELTFFNSQAGIQILKLG